MAVEFIDGNEVSERIKDEGIVIVNAFATWCGPCKMLAPVLDEISTKHKVLKVDIDKNPEFSKENGISGVPTTMIYKSGKLLDTLVGFVPKEKIEEAIAK